MSEEDTSGEDDSAVGSVGDDDSCVSSDIDKKFPFEAYTTAVHRPYKCTLKCIQAKCTQADLLRIGFDLAELIDK